MQRSTILFLVLLCALALGVTVWMWQDDEVPPPGPKLPGDEGGRSEQGPGPSQPRVEDVPEHAPHVVLTVTPRERFVPPPREPLVARRVDGSPLAAQMLCGVGAGFDVDGQQRGVAMARVLFEGGELLRQVRIDPEHERTTAIGVRVAVNGRIVDAQSQAIAGAQAWFGEFAADGSRREFVTDDDGRFEGDVPAGEGVPFVARSAGHASSWRPARVAAGVQPFEMMLQPAATLRVQLATSAKDGARAAAFVVPPKRLSTELAQWPFFLQALHDGFEMDANGRAVIDDLPADVEVRVVVRHSHALLHQADKRLRGAVTQLLVSMPIADRARLGMVVDEQGAGLSGVSIWSRHAGARLSGKRSLRMLPPHLDMRGSCHARSTGGGVFAIGGPAGDRVTLSLRRMGHAGRDVGFEDALQDALTLPAWRGGDARLRVLPPSPGKVWTVACNLGAGIEANVPADEPWVVALPYAGFFDLDVKVLVDGEELDARTWRARAATGLIELETPTIP